MLNQLPRREREIFEIVCRLGEATAADVHAELKDPPSRSAVRTLLGRLEARGMLKHRDEQQAYVYRCAPKESKVQKAALQQLVSTFFEGSGVRAATALIGLEKVSDDEIDALQQAIDEAKRRRS